MHAEASEKTTAKADGIWRAEVEYPVWRKTRKIPVTVDENTLGAEREHLERSLSERFNFFLVWVGLITAAAFAVDSTDKGIRVAVLVFGAIISFALLLVLFRTKTKLDWILHLLRSRFPDHAANKGHPRFEWWGPKAGVINLIGKIIPVICLLGLLAGVLTTCRGWF